MLTLVSVTPFWAVALKLVRYIKWDPGDICLLLRSVAIDVWCIVFLCNVDTCGDLSQADLSAQASIFLMIRR
jgi:hypothetical protein